MSSGKIKDLTGQRFGRLVVLSKTDKRANRCVVWHCICDCGNYADVSSRSLIGGKTKSCGCYMNECRGKSRTTHHMSTSKLYSVWNSMKGRCFCETDKSFAYYGGRGITVCDEWKNDFQAFYDWAIANGYDTNAKRGECTLDRIDNDGNYEPSNCRWVTNATQQNNKRNNHLITFNGVTHNISEWEKRLGFKRGVISSRINEYGWSIEKALTEGACEDLLESVVE